MFIKARTSFLSLVVIAVLVLSAVSPSIAYADGGTTPETPPTETSSECSAGSECPPEGTTTETPTDSGEAVATEAPVTDASAAPSTDTATDPNAAAVPAEGSAPAESAPAESAPAPDAPVLTEVPENTTVTVLNAEGESQPLATQDAAAAIAESDPIWCPEGQDPKPGENGCTTSFTSFSELLNFMSGNATYQGAGTIYVQQGAYKGGESSIDFNSGSYDLSNIRNSNLTITGGWNNPGITIDPAAPSTFTVPIIIGTEANPWGGALTVENVSINNASGNGLTLHSQSHINLTNVSVTNTANGSGADLNAGGNVTIESSNFVRNKVSGATIRAKGGVAISNSNFSNREDGRRRLQVKGLDITSDGSVSLANVMANGNREVGANINAGGRVTVVGSMFSGTKTINSGQFLGYGLQVVTPDAIDLSFVTANDNFLWGASLNAGGDVTIADSIFNANTTESPGFIDDTGLLVTSGGDVALTRVTADENRLVGATIDATGDVTISNSTFSNNDGMTTASDGSTIYHGYGLQVTTPGNITLTQVIASNNMLYGAHLEAGSDVTITGSDFSNQTSGTDTDKLGKGLEVISGGNIFLDSVTINNNQTFGANLQAASNIILDAVTATGNGTDGVTLQATCTQLFGGTFSGNGGYGLNLGTSALFMGGQPTFGGNGLGDMNPASPVSCVPGSGGIPGLPGDPGFPIVVTSSGSTGGTTFTSAVTGDNAQAASGETEAAALQNAAVSEGTNFGSVSLNTYLANTKTGSTSSQGVFIGKYAYVHSLAGLQIFALAPELPYLAMR